MDLKSIVTQPQKKEKEVVKTIKVISRDNDGITRAYRAVLHTDGSVNFGSRTYVDAREHLELRQSFFASMGLGNGVRPVLFVNEAHPVPIDMRQNGSPQTPYDIGRFKRMTLGAKIVRAAQRDANNENLKTLIIAALIALGMIMLLLVWLANGIGLFQFSPIEPTGGARP